MSNDVFFFANQAFFFFMNAVCHMLEFLLFLSSEGLSDGLPL